MAPTYDTERRDFATATPLTMIRPEAIRVLSVSSGVIAHYQKLMSKAVWRPAPGRKLGFLVMQEENLLGLIFLASPVIRLTARDEYLFPDAGKDGTKFNYGKATREYMDMSVCVAAQPIGWHWNLGKLVALIAPTLGNYVRARYPNDEFKGVTTTSLYGKSVQYNRIYKMLGYTKGHGSEHIDDAKYATMVAFLREMCPNCNPNSIFGHIPLIPKLVDPKDESKGFLPESKWCTVPYARFGDGANARMRIIGAYRRASQDDAVTLTHGKMRGVYYHPAVPSEQRASVINAWFERWGLPRYERTKNQTPPYESGLGGETKEHKMIEVSA